VFLKDIWPTTQEVRDAVASAVTPGAFRREYSQVTVGDDRWRTLPVPEGKLWQAEPSSTYIQIPPYFDGMTMDPAPLQDIRGARVLANLGDSITTDHISPAGAIPKDSPAGKFLIEHGVQPADFNNYGARRGNHLVMVRGTFGNIRLKNKLTPDREGDWTVHLPDGEVMRIFDASEKYRSEGIPLIVLGGKDYGNGSSRDWAAKGPMLLGVRAVLVEAFERIHRSNLVGMGVLPFEYIKGQNAASLGLTGRERYDIPGISAGLRPRQEMDITATADDGKVTRFKVTLRIDTEVEVKYYQNGGILQTVLRDMVGTAR
jgi:aconitate hydratase